MSRGRSRGTTKQRGYSGEHQKVRAQYKPAVDAGREYCRRCTRGIPPGGKGRCPACGKNHGTWDLGHIGYDPPVYAGPEHCCCNRGATKRRLGRRALAHGVQQAIRRTSREW